MDEMKKLHANIHRHDPLSANDSERHAETVMSSLLQAGMDLIIKGIDPSFVELAYFYQWFRLITLMHHCSETQFQEWTANLDIIMKPLIECLNEIADEIKDEGPSESMAELGKKVQQLKDFIHSQKTKPPANVHQQAELVNRTLFTLSASLLKEMIHPVLLQNTYFYYWLRFSTMNANVSEEFFQKLERNWVEVTEKIDQFFKTWKKSH